MALQNIAASRGRLVPASFKHVSRNPLKLYLILEYLLCSGCEIVTPNYFLTNGRVARRQNLLRPAHDNCEIGPALRIADGLVPMHRRALTEIAESELF